jgi:hypothetical protein
MKYQVLLLSATILFVLAGCRFNEPTKTEANLNQEVELIQTPTPSPQPTPEKKPDFQPKIQPTTSAFSKTDFANFTYELPQNWRNEEANITLTNGKRPMSKDKIGMMFREVKYGELTGDSSEEAIVILGIITGGITNLNAVYIFTLSNNQPKLLWNFETGDRGDGGLKDVYAENNELVVELYGKDRYIFRQKETLKVEEEYELNICCPVNFTKTHHKFNGRDFAIKGKWESLSLPEKLDFNAR